MAEPNNSSTEQAHTAQLDPTKLVVTKRRADHLADPARLEAEKLTGKTIAQARAGLPK